ncbi:hypothetical protein VOLCADRAFT_88246 [Volvox carteri f. nagariensis]|uniref:CRAL-TRIO domain-containing protein n=1 Tax=Volvox carteri f. nagariensis TaxID=3068 RepID=D8TNN7_VOLCA|nr:uncharacterized protein VOLCADRAFT_88246 [Volvox carteri f. nagariensis]EFJ51024.1 hypothetical protein VOLCADRAFT_88246 [Volvox carteri f. nagariensis]|eukprot:XP_002948036.1 hypothetical protein VOLCADRAFT_88246 [Volvox carteri f. nagariensis]
MESPTDSLHLPSRADDSELGYAPRYPHAVELNDADEPLAYKNRYNSVYKLDGPVADPSNGAQEYTMGDGVSTRVRDDSSSAPPASLSEPEAVLQSGRDDSEDEVPLDRVAAYTRSASHSARDAAAAAAAAAARTAALSQHLSSLNAESVGQTLQLLDGDTSGIATADPHAPSTEADFRTPDSAINTLGGTAPTAAADMSLDFPRVDNSNQEDTDVAAVLCAARSNSEAPSTSIVHKPDADLSLLQPAVVEASSSTTLNSYAAYHPPQSVEAPYEESSSDINAWAAVDVGPPASGTAPPPAPASWNNSDVRCCFEDVPLNLVPAASNGAPLAADSDLLLQSNIGVDDPPVEVVATVEHPVFDDPDLLASTEAYHLGPQPSPGDAEGSGPDASRAAAAAATTAVAVGPLDGGSSIAVNSQQLLDDYRIAAAAGLVSPELASLLGLAPQPGSEGFGAAGVGRQKQEEEEEEVEEREVQLGFPQVDGNGVGCLVPAVQQQQQQQPQDHAPMTHVLDSWQAVVDAGTEGGAPGMGSHHPLSVAATIGVPTAAAIELAVSGQLSGAARVQRAAARDPFDAADTDDDEPAGTSAVPAAFAAAPEPPPHAIPAPPQPGGSQSGGEASGGPAAAVAATVAGLAVAAGAAVGAVAVAGQRLGPQQQQAPQHLWQGPTPPWGGYLPPRQLGLGLCPLNRLDTPYPLPNSMRHGAMPGRTLGPQPVLSQQQHAGPPSPRVNPVPGVGPQGNIPADRGPTGVQPPSWGAPGPAPGPAVPAAAAAEVGVPPQPRGVGPWPPGHPVPGPYGPGPMPPPRPGLQPPLQPLPGAMPGGPRPPLLSGGPPGHNPVPGGPPGYPPGPPGTAIRPGVRPPPFGPGGPMLGNGRGGPMPGPGPAGPPEAFSPYPGLLYTDGRDTLGRPVVVLNTAMLPVKAKKNDVLQYVLQQLQPVVQQDYVIVVLSLGLGVKASSVSSSWALGAYRSLAKPYRKNVKHVVLVQPSAWARTLLALAQPFVSKKAAHKVKKVDNLVQISDATSGEVKLESLGARFIREIQYGLGAPPLAGLAPGPAPGPGRPVGPQRPPAHTAPPLRGPPIPGGQPVNPYPGPPPPYGPPPGPRMMPPGSNITTPVYGPGGPWPSAAGRIQGTPPPPRPQFPPVTPVPGAGGVGVGVGVGPQPAGEGFVAPR